MSDEPSKLTFSACKKLRLDNPILWDHHHGGWTYVVTLIGQNLCCDDGVLFISSVEDIATEESVVISEPWVGVVHQVPENNYPWFPDLKRLVVDEKFRQSLQHCLGLFCLSSVVSDFLRQHLSEVPVARLLYPFTPTDVRFDQVSFSESKPRNLLFIGEYMRNFQFFFNFETPSGYQKVLLQSPCVNLESLGVITNDSVSIRKYVDSDEYDKLLATSVVFLNLHDAPANTTVLECIVRNTPIVVNRLPGLEEYLGKDYPLFYDNVDEAHELLKSDKTLQDAQKHLSALPLKHSLTGESFLSSLQNSAIYRALPVPSSQKVSSRRIPEYDLTVMICSYKRVYNMRSLLQKFTEQTLNKKIEIIVWNNNFDARDELQQICDRFKSNSSFEIKVIHSTENYYCIVRLAVSSIMRSDILVICDDDVIPTPRFLEEYLSKYEQYGPDCVLCCRGHKFWRHQLNEEQPQTCWTEYENIKFYDETKEDVQIHFLHADTCLFPKHILLKAVQYPLPNYDVILVDDYWLSFVFSHVLRIPIWKIKGDQLFQSTPCAEDASIALYRNSRVREERINFYVYHMRQGWPNSVLCIGENEKEINDTNGK